MQKLKNNEDRPKFTGSYKKKSVFENISILMREKRNATEQYEGLQYYTIGT